MPSSVTKAMLFGSIKEIFTCPATREDPEKAAPIFAQLEAAMGSKGDIADSIEGVKTREDACGELPTTTVPTLFGFGDGDKAFPPEEHAVLMHGLVPNSELVYFKDAGHTSPMEQPELVYEALKAFISKY
jgi:3-oxoadipate enol-lactonase